MDSTRATQTEKPGMPENIRSMSAHRGLAIFYGLLGLTFLVLLWSDSKGWSIVGPVLLILAISAVHGAIAFGAARSASWARISSMVVACLMLLGFPIGTLIGGYLLANLKWSKRDET